MMIMETNFQNTVNFCMKHGYYVQVVPVTYKENRLDVIEPDGKRKAGTRTFYVYPKDPDDISSAEMEKQLYEKIKTKIENQK